MPGKDQRAKAATRKQVFITLRLDAALYNDLCKIAQARFRTASDEARLALHQHVIDYHNTTAGEAA